MGTIIVIQEAPVPGRTMHDALQGRLGRIGWRHWAFYVLAPLLLGVYATFENWWLLQNAGLANTLLFYCAHALLPWWLTCAVTAVVWKSLARWKPNPVIVMLLGVSIAVLVSNPYGDWLDVHFLRETATTAITDNDHAVLAGRFGRFWSYLLQPAVIWVGVNLLFDRLLDFPRYRYNLPERRDMQAAPAPAEPRREPLPAQVPAGITAPRFLDHLDEAPDFEDVCAIKAEQHYIKVHTPKRSHMVLYRFSDAIAELDKNLGLQVHRSWWVRTGAIKAIKTDAKRMLLMLESGLEVPVSQPYQALVRQTVDARA